VDTGKGKMISLKDENGGVAYITITDVNQSNAVIHVIGNVLLPEKRPSAKCSGLFNSWPY